MLAKIENLVIKSTKVLVVFQDNILPGLTFADVTQWKVRVNTFR